MVGGTHFLAKTEAHPRQQDHFRSHALLLGLTILFLLGCSQPTKPSPSTSPKEPVRILVFSKTAGFRHADTIVAATQALRLLGKSNGFEITLTEDAAAFNDANLKRYRAVVFLLTTGDVLDDAGQAAFERYIRAGGSFAGIHSATDTEYDWPWYGDLVGAYFKNHPAIQEATVRVLDRKHPSTSGLPEVWVRTDEWYNFRTTPRGKVHILAVVDEGTYSGGEHGSDHPVAWCQEYQGGRSWYAAGGHTKESFGEPLFLKHILGGLLWTSGLKVGDCPTV